jgi:alpha-tubulin suppressor-like RCC1 family protein
LGFMHSCALFSNGSVKCWGNNASGQLGLGDVKDRGKFIEEMGLNLPTVHLGTNRTAKQIVAGGGHTCALLDDDSVKCWGNNDYGQLGLDSKMYYGMGPGAILESGNVKCWGDNAYGKLGIGSTTNWGDKPGDMDKLPVVQLSPTKKAIHVAVGIDHSCVIEEDNAIRCWGSGSSGKLAQGNVDTLGDTPMTAGGAIVNIGSGRIPVALVPGAGSGSGVRLQGGGLVWWGSNGYCQLGLGHSNDIGDSVNEIGDQMPLVNLGSGQQALQAGFGDRHQCALLAGGVIRCWGTNDAGQIGRPQSCAMVGDTVAPVDLGPGFFAVVIATGGVHTCAISLSGRVKCWGSNGSGQLGLGDILPRGLNAAEMGNALPIVRLW